MSTFASLEKDGWDRNAARYEDIVLGCQVLADAVASALRP